MSAQQPPRSRSRKALRVALSRLSSRYRITQLESQVTQLTKTINDIQPKLGGESILHLEQQIDQPPVSDGSDDESTNSEGLIAEELSDFRSLFHNDILSSDTGQQHEQISERRTKAMVTLCERVRLALQRLIPCKEETAEMLVVTFDWLQMLASLLPQPAAADSHHALLARYDDICRPDVDVVELASWLLTVAITAQQIPQESRDIKPQSLGSRRRLHFSRAVSDAIETLVLSNDRLVGNISGLGLGLHFVRLLMGRGDLQGAWLKLRHFIALGELMALPRAVQSTRSKTSNGLLDEDTARRAQLWELMCTVDRLVGMFVNLPPYTRRSSNMASLLPIMADGAVQTSVYLSRLMDIAAEGHGLDDSSGMQGSKPSSYAASLEVARQARALFSETPESWWAINTDDDLKPDHIVQFVHHCTVMKAYLPIVHHQERSQHYGYSRLACIDACEKVAQMYQLIRRKLPSGFFSLNVLDLQAFTAVILLLLLSHSSPFPEVHSFQINKSGLEAVVSQVILLMEEKSNTVLGSDFARRGAHTIRSLRHLLQQDESAAHSQESSIQGPQVGHWSPEEQVTPTLCSSQLNAGTCLQNSANITLAYRLAIVNFTTGAPRQNIQPPNHLSLPSQRENRVASSSPNMEILDELEAMAQAASAFQDDDNIPESTIVRWQKLFGYSAAMAKRKIMEHRNDPLHFTVSDDHWALMRGRMEAEGHDRESYEHSYNRTSHDAVNQRKEMTMEEKRRLRDAVFLIKLEGPFSSVQAVIQAADLWSPSSTEVLPATNLYGQPCSFFKINGMDKLAIEAWLKEHPHPGFTPTIIKDPYARKDLSSTSLYPTLGLDTTLPQFRPGPATRPLPAQNEYPVWYFFYGTLADPSVLSKLFGSDFQAQYTAAKIRDGALKTWGQYNALVDDPSGINLVRGQAFLVESREQEERLRAYETNVYEVVRCRIDMGLGESVNGLTFRFITNVVN
ncbi:hypothetical protein FANTH_1850 [Fusarium anthophilum]|uniref:Gamma-glutamylcyclotransferase AIG2-like domain-containing protein n=1 Tax=Fusarium anthophilum TaxID=48485 RepID=A0A8H4ZV69_9HYPO|nr:hypothetical protein FANTH_1850 [Fusarium anthophilum]